MTAKENIQLVELTEAINTLSIKLFGNGTRTGCIDERLEHVENYMTEIREAMPKMVTRAQCEKKHETKWSRIILIIGLAATWVGLVLRAMEVF